MSTSGHVINSRIYCTNGGLKEKGTFFPPIEASLKKLQIWGAGKSVGSHGSRLKIPVKKGKKKWEKARLFQMADLPKSSLIN